jgi:hypothetical protein
MMGVVAQACNPRTQEVEQKGGEFKGSLGCRVRLSQKKNKMTASVAANLVLLAECFSSLPFRRLYRAT